MKPIKPSHIFSILLVTILLLTTSCGNEQIPKSSLIVKDNLLYKKGSNIPFTGKEKALVNNKIVEYEVLDGLKHGEFKIYFEDGNLEMQGQIDSNRNVGKWQYFYPDGKIESEGNFNLNKPDGNWIWNYPDGKRKEVGEYSNGIRIGKWLQYDNNGNVTFEHTYELVDSATDTTGIQ
jgi:antitoxin component YwqK of YwqJK toxin-antitoxin module